MNNKIKNYRIGSREDNIIELLRRGDKKGSEICAIIYGQADGKKMQIIRQALKSLLKKKIISQKGTEYHLEYYPEIIGIVNESGIQKRVTIPNRINTKDWRAGMMVKLVKVE